MVGLAMLVACSQQTKVEVPEPVVAEPCRSVEGPTYELSQIDTLMWHHPDSAFAVLMEFAASPKADSMDVFEGHYCQVHSGKDLTNLRNTHNASSSAGLIETHLWSKPSHDRWLIIDDFLYHCGHSLKDMGRKLSAITLMGTSPETILGQM